MKTVGLIAEYNPFHSGHLYHIEKAKAITGADRAVAVMSGDYVQRGVPAVMSKYLRAEAALKCGVSAVFELPVCYATGSAELFAAGAVSLLEKLGIVDCLCFGCECGDIELLKEAADFLCDEPEEYKDLLRSGLRSGLSFPRARQAAIEHTPVSSPLCAAVKGSNNILGIEYLKALKRLGSKIAPYCIKRGGGEYNDALLRPKYSSASSIRAAIEYFEEPSSSPVCQDPPGLSLPKGLVSALKGRLPEESFEILKNNYHLFCPVSENDFSLLLKSKLLEKGRDELSLYLDVSKELTDKISNKLESFRDYRQFAASLKSKETTHTRINRALLHIMLNIKKRDADQYATDGYHYYARLLGVRKDCENILGEIAGASHLPLLASINKTDGVSETGLAMLRGDILSSDLYNSVVSEKFKVPSPLERRRAILKI